jgi:adenylosuccinate synthase
MARVTPVYESMPGWDEPISGVRRFEDLPRAARAYLERIEELSGVRVGIVSVGPDRAETFTR